MSASVLLVTTDHPRRRQLEDLLAGRRTVVRDFPSSTAPIWDGDAPDLLVLGSFGRTADAVVLARAALAADADVSVLVADEPGRWPEALRLLPGCSVLDLADRAWFSATVERLLERRRLLREAGRRRDVPTDRLAAAALESETPAAREMALLLARRCGKRAHIVFAGEAGSLRLRVLRHLLAMDGEGEDDRTLLVDGIDDRSPLEQGEILRLAQHGRRVLATASVEFASRVQDGSFRTDLYYTLGGQPVTAVPLRERRADLPRLLEACVVEVAGPHVIDALGAYGWPGNLRELELVVEHAVLLSRGEAVDVSHLVLPDAVTRDILQDAFVLRIPPSGVALEEVERELLRQTLAATSSNVTEAARRLEVGREKLRYRLRKLGLGK